MFDFKLKNRGVALFVVLGTVFVVVILANVALNIMISQSRFTHHKVGRIQAYYAGWAAINYANEMLRTNAWNTGSCPAGCPLPFDLNFPASIEQIANPIMIFLSPPGPGCGAPAGCICISVRVTYTNPAP